MYQDTHYSRRPDWASRTSGVWALYAFYTTQPSPHVYKYFHINLQFPRL